MRTGGSTNFGHSRAAQRAFGFEDWTPAPEDIRALKDAAHRFDALLDDRGAPPEDQPLEEDIQAMEELKPRTFGIDTKHDGPGDTSRTSIISPTFKLHHFKPSFVPERPPSLPPMQSQHTQVQQHQTINSTLHRQPNKHHYNQPSGFSSSISPIWNNRLDRLGDIDQGLHLLKRIGAPTSEQQRQLPPEQQETSRGNYTFASVGAAKDATSTPNRTTAASFTRS